MTLPGRHHDLWIRYWLAAGGIDPDKDIETIVGARRRKWWRT